MDEPAGARAALEWLVELGADEAIGEAPLDRYALPERAPWRLPAAEPGTPAGQAGPRRAAGVGSAGAGGEGGGDGAARRGAGASSDRDGSRMGTGGAMAAGRSGGPRAARGGPADPEGAVDAAEAAAAAATDLAALKSAMDAYPHCDLRRGARNIVFSDGLPGADLMVVGEAPGRDEDIQGKPFVGRSGQLLDRMMATIGRARGAEAPDRAIYITNVLPWRPPGNRDPEPLEIAMMRPFLLRHIALAAPKVLVVMGNPACGALLGKRGITKLRGNWESVDGVPAMPTFHPAYLLRNPIKKREAWADLLALEDRLGR